MSRRTIASVVDRDNNDRLNRWADWWLRRIGGGPRGYGESPLVGLIALGIKVQTTTWADGATQDCGHAIDEIATTERCVRAMRDDLQIVVAGYWLRQMSVAAVARATDAAPATIRDRLAEINGCMHAEFREVLSRMHNSSNSVRGVTR